MGLGGTPLKLSDIQARVGKGEGRDGRGRERDAVYGCNDWNCIKISFNSGCRRL